jgi:hypothetical protein
MLFINAIVISRKRRLGKHLALLKLDLKSDKPVGCLTKGGKNTFFPFKRYGITYNKCSGSAFDTISETNHNFIRLEFLYLLILIPSDLNFVEPNFNKISSIIWDFFNLKFY